ncbi:hypothetical protein [Methylobacterium sp. Leaf117]|uniref:GT99 family glycosyltransferase N-terminal domain-containing protein n=1 Tax=Methylobacterium sp. Leaf117 TaxID=1736260 RepID=UPI001AEBC931|nr:hypothetical protein [Methylobacterium sp. Leaf117]
MKDDIALLMPKSYWDNVDEIVSSTLSTAPSESTDYIKTLDIAQSDFDKLAKYDLASDVVDDLIAECCDVSQVWSKLLLFPHLGLMREIEQALRQFGQVDAVMTWVNCPSLTLVAKNLGIPVIHNELGPLRPPRFRPTAYFDMEGLVTATEAARRYDKYKQENSNLPIMDRQSLLRFMSFDKITTVEDLANTHQLGVALHATGDAAINGVTNRDLIALSLSFPFGRPIVRLHPSDTERFSDLPVDWSEHSSSEEFLSQINNLLTVNSNIGFEALLAGKPTYLIGDSPFSAGSSSLERKTAPVAPADYHRWLNWFIFSYLIPYDLLFVPQYFRWRLSRPSETEIYEVHYDFMKQETISTTWAL